MPIIYPISSGGGASSGNATSLRNRSLDSQFYPQDFETILWNSQDNYFTLGLPYGSFQEFIIFLSSSAETGSFYLSFPNSQIPNKEFYWNDLVNTRNFNSQSSEQYNGNTYFSARVYLPKAYSALLTASFNNNTSSIGYSYDQSSLGSPVYIIQDLNNTATGTISQGGGGGGGSYTYIPVTVYAGSSFDASSTSQTTLTKFVKLNDSISDAFVVVNYEISSSFTGSVQLSGVNGIDVDLQLTGSDGVVNQNEVSVVNGGTLSLFNSSVYTVRVSSSSPSSNFKIYNLSVVYLFQ